MSFPEIVRQDALVAAARHCCVCHRYKGVGVEVHHIVPKGSGGSDTIENAIVLCFDCHAAAGHYNPKHPRGTKFSPGELRRHREVWTEIVASGKVPMAAEEIPAVHIRHLLSLDNTATSELLNLERARIPFQATYVQSNDVLRFMRRVLRDDLPFAWQTSESLVGHQWGKRYASLADLHAENVAFQGRWNRALVESDFGPDGIRSEILRSCYDEGLPLSQIGIAQVDDGDCGGGAMVYFSVRRPLYVFCEISNVSPTDVTVTALRARRSLQKTLSPRPLTEDALEPSVDGITPVLLRPGETLIVPEFVLLGPFEADDLRSDYSVHEPLSEQQSQSFGLRMSATELCAGRSDYFCIGPSVDVQGFEVATNAGGALVQGHRFRPDQCYIWHRAWHVGCCPHVFFRNAHGVWTHFGEILRKGWRNTVTERFLVPHDACLMRIVEMDFETSILDSVILNGIEQLHEPVQLTTGDHAEFAVSPGVDVEVRGHYDCAIQDPQCPDHIRQKRSILVSYQMSLRCGSDGIRTHWVNPTDFRPSP